MNVVIISGACCIPGMAAFDEQARRVINQAVNETGVEAKVTMIPAATAILGHGKIISELMDMSNKGRLGVPAILINGQVVSYGVPQLEDMKEALKKYAVTKVEKEEPK